MFTEKIENGKDQAVLMVDGIAVERDVLRVAEAVQEYDPNLKIQYLAENAAFGDPPYRVVETCRDGVERVAFYVWQLDGRLLDRIRAADCAARDLDDVITKKNRAAKDALNRRYREIQDEANEIAHAVLRSDKSKYSVRDPLTGELKVFTE